MASTDRRPAEGVADITARVEVSRGTAAVPVYVVI